MKTNVFPWVFAGLMYLFILAPILIILPASFAAGRAFAFPPSDWTLQWYQRLFNDGRLLSSVLFSLRIGLGAALGAVLVGGTAALGLERGRIPGKDILANLLLGPLVLPLVVTALALLLFFSQLGLVARPLGILIAHTVLTVPYVMRTTLASLRSFDPDLEEAAWVHGAHPVRAFWTVVLPQIRPGLVAGGIFAFLVSLDEFTVTIFLSGPGVVTMPIRIYQYIVLHVDPTVSALTSALVIVSAVVLVAAEKAFKLHKYLEF